MRNVPTTATTIRNTPRIRVRVSPRPASMARHPRPISHPVLRCAERPPHDISIVQRLMVRGQTWIDAVHLVKPEPAAFAVHGTIDCGDEDALRDLIPDVR